MRAFLLIRHYSAIVSKIHSYRDCFFGDFGHWDTTINIYSQAKYKLFLKNKIFDVIVQRLFVTFYFSFEVRCIESLLYVCWF